MILAVSYQGAIICGLSHLQINLREGPSSALEMHWYPDAGTQLTELGFCGPEGREWPQGGVGGVEQVFRS